MAKQESRLDPIAIVHKILYKSLSTYPSSLYWHLQVGVATEFPSGEHSTANLNHAEFFRLLLQKKETYQKIPLERFDIDRCVAVMSVCLS